MKVLFRGQTRKLGEKVRMTDGKKLPGHWVYGGIFHPDNDGSFAIIYSYDPIEKYAVHADTVGQYIGRDDVNGTKIFTDDICKINGESNLYIVTADANSAAIRFLDIKKHQLLSFADNFLSTGCIEVVGNKYDNPEYMEA